MLFEKSWNVLLGEDLPLFLYTSWEHIAGLGKAACSQVKSHYLCEVLFTSLHIWKHFSLRLASVVEKFLSLFIKADWLYFPRLVTCELTTQRGKPDIYNSGAYLQSGRQQGRENDVWSTRHAWPFPLLSGQKSITNSPPLNSFRWVVLKYSCLPIRGHLSLLRSCRPFLIIVQLSYCVKFRLFENFEIFENCLSHLCCARIVSQILLLIIHHLNESCSSTLACLSDICSPFGYWLAL